MKGNISLKKFIQDVKKELRDSIDEKDPFFTLEEVELEVSFQLDTSVKAGASLVVIDASGSTKASQLHKVKLKLSPFIEATTPESPKPKTQVKKRKPAKRPPAKKVARKAVAKKKPTLKKK